MVGLSSFTTERDLGRENGRNFDAIQRLEAAYIGRSTRIIDVLYRNSSRSHTPLRVAGETADIDLARFSQQLFLLGELRKIFQSPAGFRFLPAVEADATPRQEPAHFSQDLKRLIRNALR